MLIFCSFVTLATHGVSPSKVGKVLPTSTWPLSVEVDGLDDWLIIGGEGDVVCNVCKGCLIAANFYAILRYPTYKLFVFIVVASSLL